MISNRTSTVLLMLNNRKYERDNPIGWLPRDVAKQIIDIGYNSDPNSDIAKALRLAASGTTDDINALVKMIMENQQLLLESGNTITRGGFPANRVKLYPFLLAEGDPLGAKLIEFGFAHLPNGENERLHQCEEYRPQIEALIKQIKSGIPAFDLAPLLDIIIKCSLSDIKSAANKNTNYISENNELNEAMAEFRKAVKLNRESTSMHYQHHTTLMQAIDLLDARWKEFIVNISVFDKSDFIWNQIIGRLQYNLPAVDRFPFARAFKDKKRELNYQYREGAFPDADINDELTQSGIGIVRGIFGDSRKGFCAARLMSLAGESGFRQHLTDKVNEFERLMPAIEEEVTPSIFNWCQVF